MFLRKMEPLDLESVRESSIRAGRCKELLGADPEILRAALQCEGEGSKSE